MKGGEGRGGAGKVVSGCAMDRGEDVGRSSSKLNSYSEMPPVSSRRSSRLLSSESIP